MNVLSALAGLRSDKEKHYIVKTNNLGTLEGHKLGQDRAKNSLEIFFKVKDFSNMNLASFYQTMENVLNIMYFLH